MQPHRVAPWAGAVLLFALQPAVSQEGGLRLIDRGPERCISLNRLDRTEVIDDRTLIFHMRGDVLFLNYLARECPGLKREERFMYSPTSSRLCDVDTITVLEQWAFGLTRGFTCGLGPFHPISDADLSALRRGDDSTDLPVDVEIVPVDPEELEALEALEEVEEVEALDDDDAADDRDDAERRAE